MLTCVELEDPTVCSLSKHRGEQGTGPLSFAGTGAVLGLLGFVPGTGAAPWAPRGWQDMQGLLSLPAAATHSSLTPPPTAFRAPATASVLKTLPGPEAPAVPDRRFSRAEHRPPELPSLTPTRANPSCLFPHGGPLGTFPGRGSAPGTLWDAFLLPRSGELSWPGPGAPEDRSQRGQRVSRAPRRVALLS